MDYVYLGGLQTILAGQLQRCGIYITIVDDDNVEGDEYFTVTLDSFHNTFGSSTVSILDDDGKSCCICMFPCALFEML